MMGQSDDRGDYKVKMLSGTSVVCDLSQHIYDHTYV